MPENTVKDAESDVVYFDTAHDGGVLDPHNKNHGSVPRASGGLTWYRLISAATTNDTNIKASAGQVYSITCRSSNAVAVRYVKLYNKATTPTVGTDTPAMTIEIPIAGTTRIKIRNGLEFTLGIGIGTTAGVTDSDTSGVGAEQILVDIGYK